MKQSTRETGSDPHVVPQNILRRKSKMKRILALILAGVLVLGLAACGSEPASTEGEGEGGDTASVTKLSMATGGTSGITASAALWLRS